MILFLVGFLVGFVACAGLMFWFSADPKVFGWAKHHIDEHGPKLREPKQCP